MVDLAHTAPEVAAHLVTPGPDVASSTNLGGRIDRAGIWHVAERVDRFADDTEQQTRNAGPDVTVGKVQYGAVGAGTVYGDRTGLVKMVGDRQHGEILGGHILGARSTELIQELVNPKALEGGCPEVAHLIHGHPTSEAVMEAARAADGWLIHG